jgi:RNA polymerase sigma-70 factor (ECF subfamily)
MALLGLRSRWSLSGAAASVAPIDPLVERVARGDASAVADVYDQHHAQVRAFARSLVGNDEVAEDLVHEVFLSLPSAARRFKNHSSLRTFLMSIAVNHARHHVRGAMRRRRAMERLALEPPGSHTDPEGTFARRQLAEALTRALDSLPIDQRVAFILCEVEERSAAEAGSIVSAPEATVRTRLFHAKRKLREQLEREGVR